MYNESTLSSLGGRERIISDLRGHNSLTLNLTASEAGLTSRGLTAG